jgi:hypothetical protein
MNPTKDTEGVDFAANSERFGEEASTEDRSEESAADLKRKREEMKVLMNSLIKSQPKDRFQRLKMKRTRPS